MSRVIFSHCMKNCAYRAFLSSNSCTFLLQNYFFSLVKHYYNLMYNIMSLPGQNSQVPVVYKFSFILSTPSGRHFFNHYPLVLQEKPWSVLSQLKYQ